MRQRIKTVSSGTISALVLALAAGALFPADAQQSSNTNMNVSANVVQACSGLSANALNFGTHTVGTATQANTTVSFTCSNGSNWTLDSDAGQNALNTQRRLTDGSGNFLNYILYQDVNYTMLWGTPATGSPINGTGTGAQQDITIYGVIPLVNLSPPPGAFNDVVMVTLSF